MEPSGSDVITEAQRTARPHDRFWPWFPANVSVFGVSYAAFVYGFGTSFARAVPVTIIGVVPSFAACAVIALRRRDYDEGSLFQPAGRDGAWNATSLAVIAVVCVVG